MVRSLISKTELSLCAALVTFRIPEHNCYAFSEERRQNENQSQGL